VAEKENKSDMWQRHGTRVDPRLANITRMWVVFGRSHCL